MKLRVVWVVALWVVAGCAAQPLQRFERGAAVDPAPLLARLLRYNAHPDAVRVQGKLRVEGQGSAVFGARAAARQGLRLDAVSGAFSRPLLALACYTGGSCQVYLPQRQILYLESATVWGEWLTTLLRGRVPLLGTAQGAWQSSEERVLLALAGRDGWQQEVELDAIRGVPLRVLFTHRQQQRAELSYEKYFALEGHLFPRVVTFEAEDAQHRYRFEFKRVETLADPWVPGALRVPPETRTEVVEGNVNWSQLGIPLWLPAPAR